jgi:phosphoglycolate phosphatase
MVSAGAWPRAIFFDFDGVLAESVALKEQAFRDLFADYGEDIVEQVIELHRASGAISRVIKIERIHRELLGTPLSQAELADWAERYVAAVEARVVACPEVTGTTDLLDTQAARARLFVVSGTPEEELQRIVTARGWDRYFDGVYGSPRLKAEIVRTALSEFRLAAADCVFIGDTFTDRDAAVETGLAFVGRRVHFRPNPFPPGTRIVDDMAELADVLAAAEADGLMPEAAA